MIKRISLILVVIAALVGLVIIADFQLLLGAIDAMPASAHAALIGIFLAGAVLKGLRWAFYLRSARLNIRWRDGMTSYLAAMSTSPIPGGSWLAPRLAQEHGHVRMRQAAPTLFVSYIVDAITVPTIILALFIFTDQPLYSFAIPAVGISLGIVLVAMGRSTRIWNLIASLLKRSRFTCRWLPEEPRHSDARSGADAPQGPDLRCRVQHRRDDSVVSLPHGAGERSGVSQDLVRRGTLDSFGIGSCRDRHPGSGKASG
ncbi:MAG: lysylphosphatidylglycerol synthase domain-containing protein [Thermomicrobiales bacterium]